VNVSYPIQNIMIMTLKVSMYSGRSKASVVVRRTRITTRKNRGQLLYILLCFVLTTPDLKEIQVAADDCEK
jgi:hypothetical protein